MKQRNVDMAKKYKSVPAFLLLIIWLLVFPKGGISVSLNDDLLGLLVFKADLKDPTGALSSWKEEDPTPCNWTGVKCSPSNSRVVEISLDGLSLSGQIGRGILKLDQLELISLAANNLSGTLYEELADLQSLQVVNLSHNALSGQIPSSLGNLSSLRLLDLSNNYFSGFIPPILFQQCRELRFLSLSRNLLKGPIPQSIGKCRMLLSLDLSENKFSEAIPEEVGSLLSLKILDFSHNLLSGGMPQQIGSLRRLTYASFHSNNISGTIPPEIGSCTSLRTLDLSSNFLSGDIPSEMQNLSHLFILRLRGNGFEGNIPEAISAFKNLQELDLAENAFSGEFPQFLCSLRAISAVYLSNNKLWGNISSTISECSSLTVLDASKNNLTGSIPTEIFGLKLKKLILSKNGFDGEFPTISDGDCALLQLLDLSENGVGGSISSQIGKCSQLRTINLAENSFSGVLPPELGELGTLVALDLSGNKLTGNIPNAIGNIASLVSFRLRNNLFAGPIPRDLSRCTRLMELDVSLNHLDGSIPVQLGKLRGLQYLDLSWNNLSGEIPKELLQLQSLSKFDVSHNQLTGPIPTGGILNVFNDSSYVGNNGLCGTAVHQACPTVPKPIVLNPNASRTPDLMGGSGGRRKIVLSVSAIIAISAAAVIAVGIIIVSVLNIRAQTIPSKSNFLVFDSLPGSPAEDFAIGKLVMFTEGSDTKSEDLLTSAHALLNKDTEVGRGGFGIVYKAVLPDGEVFAVKKLCVPGLVNTQVEFEREVQVLGKIQHPNLVSLQGYYWTSQLQLLIYNYVPNGNLYSRLHECAFTGVPPLTWQERFKIILGTALGLRHLHHGCQPQVIHYDLKSSNILLDNDHNALISDYGLANLLPMLDRYVMSSKFQSALGYMAPEFACQSLRINEKCDVYGFGVILLELVTGRRPVEYMEDDVVILCDYVRSLLDEGKALTCIDTNLPSYPEDEVLPVIKLGLICTSQIPSNRPSMAEVVQILELIKPLCDLKDSLSERSSGP